MPHPQPNNRFPLLLSLLLAVLFVACQNEAPPSPPTATAQSALTLPPPPTITAPTTTPPRPTATLSPTPTLTPSPTLTPTPDHPIYSGPPLPRDQFGIQIHLHDEERPPIINHLTALNVGWVKVQISWKLFEPQPGQYDERRLSEIDWLTSAAAEQGIQILLSVAKAPEWSRVTTEMDGPPQDYERFQLFMRFLAERYRGSVAAYELWNEPNLQREWNGPPLSAADFVELMAAGVAGVRQVDEEVLLISGAPAPTGINDGLTAVDDRLYFQQMLAAGAAELVDGLGVHPYSWANPPWSSLAEPDPAATTHNDHRSFFFAETISDYLALLNEAGYPDKRLWLTEFGWGTFEGLDAPPPPEASFMTQVSEWQQAHYTLEALQIAAAQPRLGPSFLWNLNFGPLLGPQFSESGYSLLGPDGSPRPIYRALRTISFVAPPFPPF